MGWAERLQGMVRAGAQARGRYGRAATAGSCALSESGVCCLFRFQYSSQFMSCSNVKQGGVGGEWHFKIIFDYFEHFKKDRVVVQTSNKGNNYNPTQQR